MTTLTPIQIDAINRMNADQRYDYFIRKVVELKQLWGLASDEGWVILPEEGEEQFPVWPHAELATQWSIGEFADCKPQAITLEDWLTKWSPGMVNDNLLVAACPNQEGDTIVVAADELRDDLLEALGASNAPILYLHRFAYNPAAGRFRSAPDAESVSASLF